MSKIQGKTLTSLAGAHIAWALLSIGILSNTILSVLSANTDKDIVLTFSVNTILVLGSTLMYRQLKKAKSDFIRKEEQMKFIFNSTPIGLHWSGQRMKDDKMRVQERIFNPAHQMLTGLSKEEMSIPGIFEKITHPEDAAIQKEIRISLDNRVTNKFSMEKRYNRLDGKTVWALASWERKWDEDGKGYQEVSSMLDITELKEASENLKQKEAQLRFIFESIPIGLMWSHVETPSKGKPVKYFERLINPAHYRITGLTEEEAEIPGIFAKITHPDDLEKQNSGLVDIREKGDGEYSMEKRYVHKDGTIVWVSITWIRIWNKDRKSYKEISAVVDITEQKRISGEIENAKNEADEANAAKSQFLATMSHEIRTPMNGLLGVLHIMEPNVPPECSKYLKIAQNSANDLLDLINDILDFSKIEAGKMQFEMSEFPLDELIEQTAEIHANNAFEKGLDLYCNIRPEAAVEIESDPHKIRQVISNLISNAIKFTSNGEIEIGTRKTKLTTGQDAIEIYVRDSGIGIDEQTQQQLFQPFTQANASTTRKYGGTGLGLSICKSIVEHVGGEIGLKSQSGIGSTFWIQIPTSAAKPTTILTERFDGNQFKNALVVEGNQSISSYIETWLMRWGCQTDCVHNLQQMRYHQRNLKQNHQYDIVFIDSMLYAAQSNEWEITLSSDKVIENAKVVMLDLLSNNKFGKTPASIHASLSKPIRLRQLQSILSESKETSLKSSNIKSQQCDVSDYSQYSVLVIDDNITNRLIAKDLLFQRHLVKADEASNGIEAIQAVKEKRYDLLLMDCMMPEMDGYEATRAIRNNEAGPQNKNTPIIAFTANISKEDRERCFAEGMDDHLPKPISPKTLKRVLDKWLGDPSDAIDISELIQSEEESADGESLYNPSRLEEMYGTDTNAIAEMLEIFLEAAIENMRDLDDAVKKRDDISQIRFYAHRLKGSSANFGAEKLSSLSFELEELSTAGDLEGALKKYPEVDIAAKATFKAMENAAKDGRN